MTSSADGSQSRATDEIERLATAYACRRDALRETVEEAQAALDRVKRDHHATLRRQIGAPANARAELLAAVESSPALFRRPRSTPSAASSTALRPHG